MKRKKTSAFLLAAIILLVIVLHNKLHSTKQSYSGEQYHPAIKSSIHIDNDRPFLPAAIYRLVEVAL